MAADLKVPAMKKETVKKRGSRRLLSLLIIFFATVLVILFFQSSLSKIARVEITGNDLVSKDVIQQASGVAVGNNFFLLQTGRIEANIEALAAVDKAVVSKRFPGLVSIEVKEFPRVAFQLGADGGMQALLADGSAVSLEGRSMPVDKPILSGWRDDDPVKKKLCQALAGIPAPQLSDISEIIPDPSASYADKIVMYTRSQFEVVTTVSYLPERISYLGAMIRNVKENNSPPGVITLLESSYYSPFAGGAGTADTKDAVGKDAGKDAVGGAGKDQGKELPKDSAKDSKKR